MSTLRTNAVESITGTATDFPNSLRIQGTLVPSGSAATEPTSRFPYVVGSVAELRDGGFPAEVNSISLQGYYGSGTAGGGPLYRDSADTTTVDNGWTVFVDGDGVRWKRQTTGFGITLPNDEVARGPSAEEAAARIQAMFDAERIRQASGVPVEVTGVEDGVVPGLTDPAVLVSTDFITIFNGSDAGAKSDSGTGTESDPYVIKNRHFVGSGSVSDTGFDWTDSTATYFIELRNCKFSEWAARSIRYRAAENLRVVSCDFHSTLNNSGGLLIQDVAKSCKIDECLFSGLQAEGVYINTTGDSVLVEVTNCRADSSAAPWKEYVPFVQSVVSDSEVIMDHCEVVGAYIDLCRIWKGSWLIEFCKGEDFKSVSDNSAKEINDRGIVIRYCYFYPDVTRGEREVLVNGNGAYWTNFEIHHCFFGDPGENNRQVALFGVRDGVVHHCRFWRESGINQHANENLEAFDPVRVVFHDCWAEKAPEDAFEFVRPGPGCKMYNLVADNAAGQIVDWFGTASAKSAVDGEVHHIYGSGAEPVLITDVSGVTVHSIFAEKTGESIENSLIGIVTFEQRNGPEGQPTDVRAYGYLGLKENSPGSSVVETRRSVGDVKAAWTEAGELKTLGYTDFKSFKIR